MEGLGEFPDTKSPEEEKRMATLVNYGWETRASNVGDEEDEDDEYNIQSLKSRSVFRTQYTAGFESSGRAAIVPRLESDLC